MTTPIQWLKVAAKLLVLGITAGLLLATSPPEREPLCAQRAAPVAFQVAGTCGPGGLIVVDADEVTGAISVANGAALGLPPLDPPLAGRGMYRGRACPFTLAQGEWDIEWQKCGVPANADADVDADAGTAAEPDGGSGGNIVACSQRCTATLTADGQLLFTCSKATGEQLCQSRLSAVIAP